MCPGESAFRKSKPEHPLHRSRGFRQTSLHPGAGRGFSRLLTTSVSTGVIKRKKVKESGDVKYSSQEARSWVVRVPSVDISMCADSRRILTIGRNWEIRVGPSKMFCPISSNPRTGPPGRMPIMESEARSMSRTCWNVIAYANCLSRAPMIWE